jgi:hypothetical protein
MKKAIVLVALVAFAGPLASRVAAAETVKGTVVKVDEGARTVTFRAQGADKDAVLPVDPSVDLKALHPDAKAELTVDGGTVKAAKVERKARAPGY